MVAIRNWARGTGGTVIATLLQPIPEVYALFTNVLLLQEGHCVYCGPRDGELGSGDGPPCAIAVVRLFVLLLHSTR